MTQETTRQYAFTEQDCASPSDLAYLLNRLLSQVISIKDSLDAIQDGLNYFKTTRMASGEVPVENGNFEGATTLPPPGWYARVGKPTMAYETVTPYTGAQSLKYTTNASGDVVSAVREYAAAAGEQWKISAAVKSDGTNIASARITFYDKTNTNLGFAEVTNTTSAWVTGTTSTIAPNGTVRARINLFVNSGAGGVTVWFDEIRITRARSMDDEVLDGAIFLRPPQFAGGDNLIENGNFEASSTVQLNGFPPGWVQRGTATFAYETGAPYNGNRSAKVTVTNVNDGMTTSRKYKVRPGETWKISAAMKCDGVANASILLVCRDKNGASTGTIATTTASTTFVLGTNVGAIPANTVYAEVSCEGITAAGSAWFDDIQVFRVRSLDDEVADGLTYLRSLQHQGAGDNMVENANFEAAATTGVPVPGYIPVSATLSYDTSAPYSGNQSLRVDNSVQFGAAYSVRHWKVRVGEQYYVSGQIKCLGASDQGDIQLMFLDKTGAYVSGVQAQSTVGGTAWAFYSASGTVPAGAVYAQLALQNNRTGAGTVFFDDLLVVRMIDTVSIQAAAITTSLLAAASVVASKISVSQLSAIAADLGTITAGQIENAGNTAGVKLSGVLPGTWTRYLDLDSGDTSFLKHDKLSLNYDGSAVFNGNLRSLVGLSTTTAPAVQMLYQNTNVGSGTGADHSVLSFSLPANALGTNGDSLRITVWAHGGGNGDNVDVKFGATQVGATSLLASSTMYFSILITRTGAATQRASAFIVTNNASGTQQATPAETLSGAVTIDFRTGNAVAITFDAVEIEYLGA